MQVYVLERMRELLHYNLLYIASDVILIICFADMCSNLILSTYNYIFVRNNLFT